MRTHLFPRLSLLLFPAILLLSCGGGDKSVEPNPNADTVKPATISNLTITNATPTTISLSWIAPGDDGNTGRATAYDLRTSTSFLGSDTWDQATPLDGEPAPELAGVTQTYTAQGLSPATPYTFAIKTVDEAGNWSGISNLAAVTTPELDSIPPATVTDLAAAPYSADRIVLNWTMPGDDSTDGAATIYIVKAASEPITATNWGSSLTVDSSAVSLIGGYPGTDTIGQLTENTQYHFAIRFHDEAGNWSGISNNATASTLIGGFSFEFTDFYKPGDAYTYISSLEVSDIDDDGDPDLLVGDGQIDRAILIGLNNGSGVISFSKRVDLPDPDHPQNGQHYVIPIATAKGVAAINQYVSIVTTCTDPDNIVAIRNFTNDLDSLKIISYSASTFPVPGVGLVGLADMDGDSDTDILTSGGSSYSVSILWFNSGGYIFTAPTHLGFPGTVKDFAVADFDGNGSPDIAAITLEGPKFSVSFNGGARIDLDIAGVPLNVTHGDLDGDAAQDAVVTTTDSVYLFFSQGGTFLSHQSFYIGETALSADCGDLDLDGDEDIVITYQDGIYFLNNVGGGQFQKADLIDDYMYAGSYIRLADLDLDGDLDVVLRAASREAIPGYSIYMFTNLHQ